NDRPTALFPDPWTARLLLVPARTAWRGGPPL
ncbi:MAG: Trehalose synthase, partial [uncultured Thermomicrobiales bacterium]